MLEWLSVNEKKNKIECKYREICKSGAIESSETIIASIMCPDCPRNKKEEK